jgi:hypothetical protein
MYTSTRNQVASKPRTGESLPWPEGERDKNTTGGVRGGWREARKKKSALSVAMNETRSETKQRHVKFKKRPPVNRIRTVRCPAPQRRKIE